MWEYLESIVGVVQAVHSDIVLKGSAGHRSKQKEPEALGGSHAEGLSHQGKAAKLLGEDIAGPGLQLAVVEVRGGLFTEVQHVLWAWPHGLVTNQFRSPQSLQATLSSAWGDSGPHSHQRPRPKEWEAMRTVEPVFWLGGLRCSSPTYLPTALTGLLFEAQAPAVGTGLSAVIHGQDDRSGEQDSWGPTANDRTQQGLTAS